MKEQLIAFETAKTAKEKGFNIPQSNRYLVDQHGKESLGSNRGKQTFGTQAPTQALLQKWLREVHKLHISIDPYSDGFECYIYRDTEEDVCIESGIVYATYEEALEKGLQEALKLI